MPQSLLMDKFSKQAYFFNTIQIFQIISQKYVKLPLPLPLLVLNSLNREPKFFQIIQYGFHTNLCFLKTKIGENTQICCRCCKFFFLTRNLCRSETFLSISSSSSNRVATSFLRGKNFDNVKFLSKVNFTLSLLQQQKIHKSFIFSATQPFPCLNTQYLNRVFRLNKLFDSLKIVLESFETLFLAFHQGTTPCELRSIASFLNKSSL